MYREGVAEESAAVGTYVRGAEETSKVLQQLIPVAALTAMTSRRRIEDGTKRCDDVRSI